MLSVSITRFRPFCTDELEAEQEKIKEEFSHLKK